MKKTERVEKILRRFMVFVFCAGMACFQPGCGQDEGRKNNMPSYGIKEVMQEQKDKEDALRNLKEKAEQSDDKNSEPASMPQEGTTQALDEETKTDDEVDVDLTVMSSTMIYSEVYNMMCNPDSYVGKTIKVQGNYAVSNFEGNHYDLCVIQDATACCAQGMEFVLTEDYAYPDDYPEIGNEIIVTGVFETYYEGERKYCTLRNARLL